MAVSLANELARSQGLAFSTGLVKPARWEGEVGIGRHPLVSVLLACPRHLGRLSLIATLHDPTVIRDILAHRASPTRGRVPAPPLPRATTHDRSTPVPAPERPNAASGADDPDPGLVVEWLLERAAGRQQ